MNLRRYASAVRAYADSIEAMRALHALQQSGNFLADKQRDDEIRELRDILNGKNRIDSLKALQMEEHLRDLENEPHAVGTAFRPPPQTLLALGSAHFRNGDPEAAEANWKAAVEVNPKYGEAHNNLAVIYMQTGRVSEAEAELQLAEKNGFRVNPQFKRDLKDRQKAAKSQ
jgi:Flp pilus assembly protein TadD